MKKWAAIFVLSIYIFGATDACQLLKFPILVQHYVDHKYENPSLSLSGFLKMHYTGKIVVDDDFLQDMKLPFKTYETGCCISIATIVPSRVELEHVNQVPHLVKYIVWNDVRETFLSPSSIFQPPRL